MATECKTRRTFDVRVLQKPLPALAAIAISGRAEASGESFCIFDSECPRGRCVDLVCVDTEPPQRAKPATSPPVSPPAPAQPPSAVRRREVPPARAAGAAADWETWKAEGFATPEETSPSIAPGGSNKRVWYGAPLIGTYAATAIVGGYAIAENAPVALVFAVFSSPTVHWLNGKGGKGTLSLFMQPVFAGLVAALFGGICDSDQLDCEGETIAGAAVGFAGWAAIDIAAIAYKSPPVLQAPLARAARPAPSFPRIAVAPFRAQTGLGAEVVGVW